MNKQSSKISNPIINWIINPPIKEKRLLLARSLNIAIIVIMLLFWVLNLTINPTRVTDISSLRLLAIILICILNIFLLNKKYTHLFKIILIFLPVFILFYLPTFMGFHQTENYFYYQMGIIGFSVIPALILSHSQEKWLYIISISYHFVLLLAIDQVLLWFAPETPSVFKEIGQFYLYYKLVPIIIFFILQGSIFYMQHLNTKSENKLIHTSRMFGLQNDELKNRNEKIERQSALITRQKKDLTDSITYAKYIQSGLLPSTKIMNYLFPNHFILNMPRDIVSGDFYWVAKQKDEITIVLADCMGHGVPGAFISILGLSILKEVYNHNSDLPTGTFMNEVREHVMISLNQTGTIDDLKVGMDMSLLKINKKTNHVSFTGANQNLYYFKNGKFNEVKGDRMPVGVQLERNLPFSTNEFSLEKGDSIYMFSDGFPDQFGGEKNKKYNYYRFKKTLGKFVKHPINEQKELLRNELLSWQGNQERIDDIMIIGIQL